MVYFFICLTFPRPGISLVNCVSHLLSCLAVLSGGFVPELDRQAGRQADRYLGRYLPRVRCRQVGSCIYCYRTYT
ncbi:hypothetical protein F4774DRAFT_332969 [Daldinia eschscholtzii]|nr:hypothetical protein F4774DRAFT_332969 [Daldinia eschscholtzii]